MQSISLLVVEIGPRIESEKSYWKARNINPKLEVIIPTKNEEHTIRDLIKDIRDAGRDYWVKSSLTEEEIKEYVKTEEKVERE